MVNEGPVSSIGQESTLMNGGDLYELAKILRHSNIKMTERYAKLAKHHIARTSNTVSGNVEVTRTDGYL